MSSFSSWRTILWMENEELDIWPGSTFGSLKTQDILSDGSIINNNWNWTMDYCHLIKFRIIWNRTNLQSRWLPFTLKKKSLKKKKQKTSHTLCQTLMIQYRLESQKGNLNSQTDFDDNNLSIGWMEKAINTNWRCSTMRWFRPHQIRSYSKTAMNKGWNIDIKWWTNEWCRQRRQSEQQMSTNLLKCKFNWPIRFYSPLCNCGRA